MIFLLLIPLLIFLVQVFLWVYRRFMTWIQNFRNGRVMLFTNGDMDSRVFYVRRYKRIPRIYFISELDAAKAFQELCTWNRSRIEIIYQSNYYNWKLNRNEFTKTVFSIGNGIIVELGTHWVEILSSDRGGKDLEELIRILTACRAEEQAQVRVIGFRRNPVLEN